MPDRDGVLGADGESGDLSVNAEGLNLQLQLKEDTGLQKSFWVSGKTSSDIILHFRANWVEPQIPSMTYADTRAGRLLAALSAPKKPQSFTLLLSITSKPDTCLWRTQPGAGKEGTA